MLDRLLSLLVGVALGAGVAVICRDIYWKQQAWEHHAAVYYCDNIMDCELSWAWADDFFTHQREQSNN